MSIIAAIVLLAATASRAACADPVASRLPAIPESIFGVNQYNVGLPADLAKGWPLTDDEAVYLKSMGCNTVKFPLYPSEVGIDEKKLVVWNTGDKFDVVTANSWTPDWRSLDALMEWMIRNQLTPNVCPSIEVRGDWTTKTWMSLHVPEQAQRAVWFTELIVDHITKKYGDNVIYGWYENWYWNSYKHEKSAEFPAAFRRMLRKMYGGKISQLNKAWKSGYGSFDEVQVPVLFVNGNIPEEAVNSIRTYDLRRAMDLMQREALTEIKRYISKAAPNAVWAGGCMLNELGGLNDIRSAGVPRTNATMRTCVATSDIAAADIYAPKYLYYSYYRTLAKICAVEGKKFSIVEAAATKPETFGWIANIGGPTVGTLAWSGKEDAYGFIKWDGTRREENARKFKELRDKMLANPDRYRKYRPGHIRVYFPEETYYYSITARNQMDAYQHICDNMAPEELEPVLTDELPSFPDGKVIYVLERTVPLKAIRVLQGLGDRVICPHDYFVDEYGDRHDRKAVNKDFYARLLSTNDGAKLLDAFRRVEEKENNLSYRFLGTTISSPSELAENNLVISGRENDLSQLIDGSIFEGVTFADKHQSEIVTLRLIQPKEIYGAFVQFYEGDGQDVPASALPEQIKITTSMDGVNFSEFARISGSEISMRPHIRFAPVRARYITFDFGENARNSGLKIEELGVIGKRR